MKPYGRSYTTAVIIVVVIVFYVLVLFLFPLPGKSETTNPQIVLQFMRTHPDGKIRFFTPQQPVAFGLLPLNENTAPLSPGSLAICHLESAPIAVRFIDGKEAGPLNDIVFKCGQDRYLFTTLAVAPDSK